MFVKKITTQLLVLVMVATFSILPASSGVANLGVSEAHELAMRGEIILIDVRTPQEWKNTGIGASARAVSMHLPGFFKKIGAIVHGNKSQPIALICASGARSSRMQTMLHKRGYTNIISVTGGMLGSSAAPGWLNTGLPVKDPG